MYIRQSMYNFALFAIPAMITELMLVNSPFSVVAGLVVVAAALVVNTCCIRNKNLTHGYLVFV